MSSVYTPSSGSQITTNYTAPVFPGQPHQGAGNLYFGLNNDWKKGETITIGVGGGSSTDTPANPTHCVSASDFVAFDNTPAIGSVGGSNGMAGPMIRVSLSTQSADPAACSGIKDQLNLTFVNSATGDTTSADTEVQDAWTVTVSQIYYLVGLGTKANNSTGPIGISAADTTPGSGTASVTADPNAAMVPVSVASNSPSIALDYGQTKPISNVTVTELHPGELVGAGTSNQPASGSGGEVSMCLNNGNTWVGNATITATNTKVSANQSDGFGSSVTLAPNSSGVWDPNDVYHYAYTCYFFYVQPTDSTTGAASLVASGLTVLAGLDWTGGPQYVTLTDYIGGDSLQAVAFDGLGTNRIQGGNADDTAVATFNNNYPGGEGLSYCNGGASIVIASDTEPWDALSAQLLADNLGTGVIVIPGTTIPQNVLNLIRNDGIGNVYIVGGTAVISQAVQDQLASTQAYFPGGTEAVNTSNANGFDGYYTYALSGSVQPIHLNVIRIAGSGRDQTSAQVDQYFGFWGGGGISPTPGAYATDIYANGEYNDTTGSESAAGPNFAFFESVPTAIVTTDSAYKDALAAGTLAYSNSLPVVLTPGTTLSAAAQSTLMNMGIDQVIVMGGPAAISNAVVGQIQGLLTGNSYYTPGNSNVSVLRIAGQNAQDTSQQFARFLLGDVNQDGFSNGLGYSNSSCDINNWTWVATARSDKFTDALTAASWLDGEPLLLTQSPTVVGPAIDSFLKQGGTYQGIGSDHVQVWGIDVFGGPQAQSQGLVNQEINDIASSLA